MTDQSITIGYRKGGMMVHNHSGKFYVYRILVKETFNKNFADWHANLTVIPQENGNTCIIGAFIDQPALRGFLEQLWNLNITVITVERIENEN